MGRIDTPRIHQPVGEKVTPRDLVAAQQGAIAILREISRRPQLSSELIVDSTGSPIDISLVGGDLNLVEHGLGRQFVGYKIVYADAPVVVWVDESASTDQTKYLPLGASASATVRLEVF